MRRRATLPSIAIGAALLAFGLLLAAWGWDRGADPWIDFGRELYVPWRMIEGDTLYRDLAWFNGPFSPWWNAAWMALFGVSIDTLQAVDVAVTLLIGLLLYLLLRAATDRAAAAACVLVFFPVFAFAQQNAVGSYTYSAPYSHEIVHGFALGLLAMWAFGRARADGRRHWFALGGAALGTCFLTKAEVFLAAAGGGGLAFLFALRGPRLAATPGERLRVTGATLVGALLPIAAAWWGLSRSLETWEALRGLAGTWAYALDGNLSGLRFYRMMRGTEAPLTNLLGALRVGAGILLVALLVRQIAIWRTRRAGPLPERGAPLEAAVLIALGAAIGVAALLPARLSDLARPLPFFLMLVVASAVQRALSSDEARRERGVATLVLCAYAGLMLIKLGLRPSFRLYGFVLAVPATMVALAALLHDMPERIGRSGPRMRALALGLVVALVAAHLAVTYKWYERREIDVGKGGDHMRVLPWRGSDLPALLADLDARVPADGTLLVLPEGVSLNYWLRRKSPIPVFNFMPPELLMFGESEIVAALTAEPPDVVVLAHKETVEYGYRFFGQGYGEGLMAWLQENYVEAARYGAAPLTAHDWGALVLVPR